MNRNSTHSSECYFLSLDKIEYYEHANIRVKQKEGGRQRKIN